MSGSLAPAELAEVDVPVLLDGAQGVGAVPVDVHALGCDAYAGAGQKWLCGPDGTGMLYVSPGLRERLAVSRRGYGNLADPNAGLRGAAARGRPALRLALAERRDGRLRAGGRRAARVGRLGAVHERARDARRAARRAARASAAAAWPRAGESTLVSFPSADPEGERARLAEAGVILRNIPGRPWLRASVGAWNDEDDLERLLGDALPMTARDRPPPRRRLFHPAAGCRSPWREPARERRRRMLGALAAPAPARLVVPVRALGAC